MVFSTKAPRKIFYHEPHEPTQNYSIELKTKITSEFSHAKAQRRGGLRLICLLCVLYCYFSYFIMKISRKRALGLQITSSSLRPLRDKI